MNKLKKAAIISAMVLMISIVPAFALDDTNNTNGTQDQNQTQNQTQTQKANQTQTQNTTKTADPNCQKNCDGPNGGTCDKDQHKYQYGQKNGNAIANNSGNDNGEQHKYQYGLKNDDTCAKNCVQNSNCPKTK